MKIHRLRRAYVVIFEGWQEKVLAWAILLNIVMAVLHDLAGAILWVLR